jgi:hypothetical protein
MSRPLPLRHSPLRVSASPVVVTHRGVCRGWSVVGWLLLLGLASPVWAATLRCMTYEEKTHDL